MDTIHSSISNVLNKYKTSQIIIGGDFKLPGIDWLNDTVLQGTNKRICELFINILNDFGLSQHTNDITRPSSSNILDLILTNNPNSVTSINCAPGMSDHNVVISVFNVTLQHIRKPPRTNYLYNKTDWENVRTKAKLLKDQYFSRTPDNFSVEENSVFIQSGIEEILTKHVPNKTSKSKFNLPWLTRDIKKLQNKRDKLYIKAVKSKTQMTGLDSSKLEH
eukprot:Seg9885.1 transcript_id=Seg9885.1/GoldUCD/mRNA.D3Y31 product="hypothetical protein" protein_id=Seg9885.1/GoldUCD/D3Y31